MCAPQAGCNKEGQWQGGGSNGEMLLAVSLRLSFFILDIHTEWFLFEKEEYSIQKLIIFGEIIQLCHMSISILR